jgi:hypothetical protein
MAMDNKAFIAAVFCAIFVLSNVALVYAQTTIPTPSVPEFTLKYIDNSYDVPTTTTTFSTIDPYTNRTITRNATQQGYHVTKLDVEVTIKNQPFPSTINGNNSNLYYDIAAAPHFGNYTFSYPNVQSPDSLTLQSSTEYTVVNVSANSFPPSGEVDFRVSAILGYTYRHSIPDHILPIYSDVFVYAASNWTDAQTITIPETPSESPSPIIEITLPPTVSLSPTPSPSPVFTSTPIRPSSQVSVPLWLYSVTVVMALAIGLLLGIIVVQKRNKKGLL